MSEIAPARSTGTPTSPTAARTRATAWVWSNLFGTWTNTALTIAVAWLVYRFVLVWIDWLFLRSVVHPADIRKCIDAGGACWAFLDDKWRLILFGTYPYDMQWRPALALVLFASLVVAVCVPASWATRERRRWLAAAWMVGLGLIGVLMAGGLGLTEVPVRLWSGLPLTVLLAACGIFAAFWLSILLALGRQSDMPVIRWLSVGYIELVRGVPLISLLFMANLMLPVILPQGFVVPNLMRAQVAFILFFAAYMAEALRGGLQAIPQGQYAAAKALGLGYWQRMIHVILPQAIRIVIPSLVNIFIGGFKDTSLVIVIGMLDLLGTAQAAKADPKWAGLFMEAYFFIAVIYLVICATMSWYSRFLERRLSTGAASATG